MKITLEIPDDIFAEIIEFKKKENITDTNSAISKLIKSAISMPEYFRKFDWEMAEKDADEDVLSGRTKEFATVDELIAELNS